MSILETAIACHRAGLCVLPAILADKRPAVPTWKAYQARLPTEAEVTRWFGPHQAMCLICGTISGNLEMIDFDLEGEAFGAWYEQVEKADSELLARLVIEQSPSGGWHVVYRSRSLVCGNMKLAQRKQLVDGPDEVTIGGKTYRPRRDADGRWHVVLTLIETRGEGGLFLCAPTPGYELLQGEFAELPVLEEAERNLLLEAAWSLGEHVSETPPTPPQSAHGGPEAAIGAQGRPGDEFNEQGDVREILKKHGWRPGGVRPDGNQHWTRPGKRSGTSATLKDGTFFVFSSSAAPFEPNRAYSPFSIYAMLEHGGDFAAAASALRNEGYGHDGPEEARVDLSRLLGAGAVLEEGKPEPVPENPGPVPEELFRVPGFVSEVIDLCLKTAPYPNPAMAFCGALALQAFLAGRKVRDPGDNRTNIYLLGLAYSSAGKDWIRKLTTKILHHIGLSSCLGDRLASGEGIQDALFARPSMLFQTDEIDSILQSINRAKDNRHESMMSTLLSLYSASNSSFSMRPKADKPDPGVIDQPNLVLFGTAIPNHYYAALSERMLTNGFFARMLILESPKRNEGQEPDIIEVTDRVLATAKWWADFRPGTGNLQSWHPTPATVEHTDQARRLTIETRKQAEAEYALAEDRSDPVGTTVWGRVSEQSRKLALLYAISENHQAPRIDAPAVQWASCFVMHQVRRMLFMAAQHVADNPFHAECLKLIEKLREAPGQQLPHSVLLKRMKMGAKGFRELIDTLLQRGDISVVPVRTSGRTGLAYRLGPG